MAIALTSAAPKPHQQVLEMTKRQNDTVQMEIENQENILSQVSYFLPVHFILLNSYLLICLCIKK